MLTGGEEHAVGARHLEDDHDHDQADEHGQHAALAATNPLELGAHVLAHRGGDHFRRDETRRPASGASLRSD